MANEPAAVTEEDRVKDDAPGTDPDYSLAGPYNNESASGNVYVSPQYRKFNPQYGKQQDEPVWSLAQPFPRVVRPGMKMTSDKGEEVVATETVCSPISYQ